MAELWEKTKDYSYKASYVLSIGAIIYVMVRKKLPYAVLNLFTKTRTKATPGGPFPPESTSQAVVKMLMPLPM
jgi:hypothetical protein